MSWFPIDPLDYSPSGDDIDAFATKYIQEINAVYSLLNRLRKLDASGNNNVTDPEAYQLKVDTSDSVNPKLLIRNGANSDWILLGKIATNFGYDPASIGAVSNKAGAKDISVGAATSRPITGEEGSMYFSFPNGELSYFTAGAWETILTMDITKLLNFDKVVTKDMTSTTKAAGKIPVADGTGKLDADITGSAEKLSSIPLDKSAKADGRVLIYYSATNTFAFADPGTLPGGSSIVGVIAPRENLKPYGVGEMVYTSRLASGKFLTCVVAGTSGSEQPDYSSPTNGLIVDGGVSWRIDSMKGVNTQVSDSEVLNQNSGDILLQTGADSDDGGKYITLKLKNGSTYKKLYIEPDNRSLIESVGYGVISGLQVNPQSVPDMTVRVEFGVVHMPSGKRFEMATVPSITINPADNTGVRNDLIYISPTGTVSYAPGTLSAAAVAGRRTYTVTTNFAAGNTITIGAVVLTAGTQFAVGADIAATVQNIANALLANTTITNTYNVTSDAVSFTLTEKAAGGLNTPPIASYTGAGVINNGTATNSAVAVFTDPVCPSNAVSLANIVVNPNDTVINAGNIADIRNFNSTAVLKSTVDSGANSPGYFSRDIPFYASDKLTIATPNRFWVNIAKKGYMLETQRTFDISADASWDSAATLWQANHYYAVNDVIYPATTKTGYYYRCTTAGKSSTLAPTFPTTLGATYNDGNVVWICELDFTVAANRKGKDFYIYSCVPANGTELILVLSANSTVPLRYTAGNSRKIGGFHCLCADVGTITGHTLSGYVAGNILPASVWDLKHRPVCSPEGMVFIDGMNVWMGIYLLSSSGTAANRQLATINNGVIADGTSTITWNDFDFIETLGKQRMRLPSDDELTVATQGNPQGVAILGAADPNTTGGHVSTSNIRLISNYGIEDGCGAMWQWTRGYFYNSAYARSLFGGSWSYGASCGSRYLTSYTVGALDALSGARAASEPLAV